jgi:hypothetical protein
MMMLLPTSTPLCVVEYEQQHMASLVFVFSLLPFVKEYVLWCDELDEELTPIFVFS